MGFIKNSQQINSETVTNEHDKKIPKDISKVQKVHNRRKKFIDNLKLI